MNFSFGATAGASQNTSKPTLKGGDIYTITFKGIEARDIQGVKDPTQVYKVLDIKFENEDGRYVHTIFEPKQNDFDRKENEFTNKDGKVEKIPQPSNVESMMLLFKHLIDTINPKLAKEIDEGTKSLAASNWEELRGLLVKIGNASADKITTKIKLVSNNKGEASFPFFASVSREGKAYIRNNFIGEKVAFTPYELQRINAARTATPTRTEDFTMGSESAVVTPSEDLDIEFEVGDL